jgi:apolipoprotein N-acyltransferase
MDSKLKRSDLTLALLVTALSSVGFYFGTDLLPPWWLIWMAALPVLWTAPRVSWPIAGSMALVARTIGGLNSWSYHQHLQIPLWANLVMLLEPALAFALAVLPFRAFMRRQQPWLAVLAYPVVIVACEYLFSLLAGTFGDTAYTQLDNVTVLQVGALAGIWGTGFVVLLFAPMIVAIAASLPAYPRARMHLTVAFVLIYASVFGYGTWRMATTPASQNSVRVGLIASVTPQNVMPTTDEDAMRIMREYAHQIPILAAQGAKIVVLPEMTALVHDSISSDIDTLFQQTAIAAHTQILLGILHVVGPANAPTAAYNESRLYSDSGAPTAIYHKHHLVPGFESRATPGDGITVSSQPLGKIGLAICRDMDYPEPANRYGQLGIGLLLVPAWDQSEDRWWHGHMALMRGVENGYSIVRSAKNGFLTVSDDRGRVLAETTNLPTQTFTTLLATVPVRHDATLYQSWGDWFAWLNLAGLVGLLAAWLNIGRRASVGGSRSEVAPLPRMDRTI